MSRLVFKKGNLLDATEQYIAHQCNCITTNSAGLAAQISKHFPYADPYSNRKNIHGLRNRAVEEDRPVPGSIQIYGNGIDQRYVIGMFAQYNPGNVIEHDREKWFWNCLREISYLK